MSLESMPRVRLAHLPTPLDDAPRLSALLGGPRILIKRDDMTGLAFGGNKTRKLEYLLGDAMRLGADTIFTSGAPHPTIAARPPPLPRASACAASSSLRPASIT